MTPPVAAKVQFKFRKDAGDDDRERLIATLQESGAEKVEPLFPGAPDDELAALYSALVGERDVRRALRLLRRSKTVEFAEPEVQRRLVRPA